LLLLWLFAGVLWMMLLVALVDADDDDDDDGETTFSTKVTMLLLLGNQSINHFLLGDGCPKAPFGTREYDCQTVTTRKNQRDTEPKANNGEVCDGRSSTNNE
jgi:hypothetical protein